MWLVVQYLQFYLIVKSEISPLKLKATVFFIYNMKFKG